MENQIIELITQSVNLALVVICLAIGFVMKHAVTSVKNDKIPVILLICGIAFSFLINIPNGFNDSESVLSIIITGIASGWTAIGIHQTGKLFMNMNTENKTEETPEDALDDEEDDTDI